MSSHVDLYESVGVLRDCLDVLPERGGNDSSDSRAFYSWNSVEVAKKFL